MKKRFITTILIAAVVLTGCSIKGEDKTEVAETTYFDFTSTEIIHELGDWMIDFTPIAVVDNEENTEKFVTYTSQNDVFTTDADTEYAMMHYHITCDDTTNKTSRISFFIDRNSPAASERYLYTIHALTSCIDTDANTEDITDIIVKGFKELDFAIYEGENFQLTASRNDAHFNAIFTPHNKGDN